MDSNWSIEYTISNNQLLMYEEPEEGNPTSVYNIKELTKSKLVLLYKVDDSDGYKAEITTTFKKSDSYSQIERTDLCKRVNF